MSLVTSLASERMKVSGEFGSWLRVIVCVSKLALIWFRVLRWWSSSRASL